MNFHIDGTLPQNNEIFVFGSNLKGIHGAGAAKIAWQKYGAKYGKGIGLCGNSYAIPTKNENIITLDLHIIKEYVNEFVLLTQQQKHMTWFVTMVGCGLAGYSSDEIAPLFKHAKNCNFALEWKKYLI